MSNCFFFFFPSLRFMTAKLYYLSDYDLRFVEKLLINYRMNESTSKNTPKFQKFKKFKN